MCVRQDFCVSWFRALGLPLPWPPALTSLPWRRPRVLPLAYEKQLVAALL